MGRIIYMDTQVELTDEQQKVFDTPCELCKLSLPLPKPCAHAKNGYCAVFRFQASLDKVIYGPKIK